MLAITVQNSPGPGPSVDLQAMAQPRTYIFSKPANTDNSIWLEISHDNANFAPLIQLSKTQALTTTDAYRYARANRSSGGDSCLLQVDGPATAPNLPQNQPGKLLTSANATTDLTWAINAETLVLTANFTVPQSGIIDLDVDGNANHGNGVNAGWAMELVGVANSKKLFTTHGHTNQTLDAINARVRYSGLTAGASLTANLYVTPSGSNVTVLAASQATNQHLAFRVFEGG